MNRHYIEIFISICIAVAGFLCGFFFYEPIASNRYSKFVHPYNDYSSVMAFGDTALYNKIVKERRTLTPSHPDYLDLSISIACRYKYTPGYYNAYLAINDLYGYNNFKMGKNVKRLMYSYLQLAIQCKDNRITTDDLDCYYAEYPQGIEIIVGK